MARYNDFIRVAIKTEIALVMQRITKENTQGGAGSKFISGSGRKVRIALTPKHTQVVI